MEKLRKLPGSEKQLRLLPAFAEFIIESHKSEFLAFSRKMLREMDLPLLKLMSVEDGDALADKSNMELLTSLSNSDPAQHIEKAIDRWRTGQFPRAQRNHFVVEDVTGIGHMRKMSFLQFLPKYTSDPAKIIEICGEIDAYILEYTSSTLHNFVGIIDDRIHEYVEHLERRTRELQESNASLEEFAYVASHDLKEPLRKISVFIKLLNESMEWPGERQRSWYQRIEAGADRMRNLIDDLLSLSLLSAEQTPELYSLKAILDGTLQLLDNKIEETGAIVKSSDLPEAKVIPSQFDFLFHNLLSNSLKFTKEGIRPEITVTHRTLGPGESHALYGLPKRSHIEITINDNGIGFDNRHSDRIFAVFQRLHNKDAYDGTGIGLAICRKVMKNHEGVILGRGQEGKGSEFVVVVPAG
ncbi:MAG TPA: ATP-binding protein [Cyclobacteriaceae bacterium]|nr:ATP-binding protein [Cyclobacteriaceae bacterium]